MPTKLSNHILHWWFYAFLIGRAKEAENFRNKNWIRWCGWFGTKEAYCCDLLIIYFFISNQITNVIFLEFEQLQKMDLEARTLPPSAKATILAKLREYKTDFNSLKNESKRLISANANLAARDQLLESGRADALLVCMSFSLAKVVSCPSIACNQYLTIRRIHLCVVFTNCKIRVASNWCIR